MATPNKKINVTELDFDSIKSNLKTFLKGQSEFQDYDFEGSGLSVLLDILAYNTHYNALYNNLAINEMFLESASKRNSVVSLAKMLGYTPRSSRSARAVVNVEARSNSVGPQVVTIPQYSQFSAVIDGANYLFYNLAPISATGPASVYSFNGLELVQGSPLNYRYTVAEGARYLIPNANADLSTLRVRVQENSTSSVFNTYSLYDNMVNVTDTSRAYWIKEIDDGLYELTFGNNLIGVGLQTGNIIHIDYFVSDGTAPNGCRTFKYEGSTLYSGANVIVTTITPAAGGDVAEGLDSIKFNAPRSYSAQNRAVTGGDYKTIVSNGFPDAKSVTVWGGEDNEPPVYGKVFICVKPHTGDKLTTQQKSDIVNTILSGKNVVSVIPEVIDPEYLHILLDITVYYSSIDTTRNASQIAEIVRNAINNYNESDLERFESVFRFSKLSRIIDSSEVGIVSNNTTVQIHRRVLPRYNTSAEYTINLVNPVYTSGEPEEAILTNGFYIEGSSEVHYMDDDGKGNVRLYYYGPEAEKIIINPSTGTIDYSTGLIQIKRLNITGLVETYFEFYIKPSSNDIVSAYNQLAIVDMTNIKITAIDDQTISGDFRAGKNYKFVSSRT